MSVFYFNSLALLLCKSVGAFQGTKDPFSMAASFYYDCNGKIDLPWLFAASANWRLTAVDHLANVFAIFDCARQVASSYPSNVYC